MLCAKTVEKLLAKQFGHRASAIHNGNGTVLRIGNAQFVADPQGVIDGRGQVFR